MDVEGELRDLRREVLEGRNLIIRTDNLLKTLHAEVKAFGTRQKEFERSRTISSGAAYGLFVLLAGGGALLLSGARASAVSSERDKAVAELSALTHSIEREHADQAAVAATRRSATDAFRMMTELSGARRQEGLAALSRVDQSKLDSLERLALADRATALRREQSQQVLEKGKAALRDEDWVRASEELSRFLTMQPTDQEQLEASFLLGGALFRQRRFDAAISPLKTFVEKDLKNRNRVWAMALLAHAYEQSGQSGAADAVVREAVETYSPSTFMPMRARAARRSMSTFRGEGSIVAGTPGPAPNPPEGTAIPGPATARLPRAFRTAAESSAGLLPSAGSAASSAP